MSIVLDGTNGITTPQINAGNIVGQVCFFGMTTAPEGFLKANGAAISRTTFAALFAAIGTTYGAGDGSTTFNLPDLRGEFPRGFDDGRGVDSGRAFGSSQLDQMQKLTGSMQGRISDTGGENNFFARVGVLSKSGSIITGTGGTNRVETTSSRTRREEIAFDSADSPNVRASDTTSGETRARNVALLACIKF